MYRVSAQGVDEHMINVHYYYYHSVARLLPPFVNTEFVSMCVTCLLLTLSLWVTYLLLGLSLCVCHGLFSLFGVEVLCLTWPVFFLINLWYYLGRGWGVTG